MSKSIITFAITVSIITIDCIHVVVHATSSTISSVSDIAISSSIMKLLFKTPPHTSPEGQVQEDLIVGRKAGSPPVGAALKHTGWMPPAYLYSLTVSAKVEGRHIVNSDII